MNIESVGRTANSYAKFKDYLSQQADLLDESLVDGRPNTKDVYVRTESVSDHRQLGDVVVSKKTLIRQDENLTFKVKNEEMIGYPINERFISFHKLADGNFRVTDFDGQNMTEMNIEA